MWHALLAESIRWGSYSGKTGLIFAKSREMVRDTDRAHKSCYIKF